MQITFICPDNYLSQLKNTFFSSAKNAVGQIHGLLDFFLVKWIFPGVKLVLEEATGKQSSVINTSV